MSFRINFTLNRKPYTAEVAEEKINGAPLWLVEIEKGGTYLFSREARGWHCPELNKDICKVVGRAIDARLETLQAQ
jgi:hypothetical protein